MEATAAASVGPMATFASAAEFRQVTAEALVGGAAYRALRQYLRSSQQRSEQNLRLEWAIVLRPLIDRTRFELPMLELVAEVDMNSLFCLGGPTMRQTRGWQVFAAYKARAEQRGDISPTVGIRKADLGLVIESERDWIPGEVDGLRHQLRDAVLELAEVLGRRQSPRLISRSPLLTRSEESSMRSALSSSSPITKDKCQMRALGLSFELKHAIGPDISGEFVYALAQNLFYLTTSNSICGNRLALSIVNLHYVRSVVIDSTRPLIAVEDSRQSVVQSCSVKRLFRELGGWSTMSSIISESGEGGVLYSDDLEAVTRLIQFVHAGFSHIVNKETSNITTIEPPPSLLNDLLLSIDGRTDISLALRSDLEFIAGLARPQTERERLRTAAEGEHRHERRRTDSDDGGQAHVSGRSRGAHGEQAQGAGVGPGSRSGEGSGEPAMEARRDKLPSDTREGSDPFDPTELHRQSEGPLMDCDSQNDEVSPEDSASQQGDEWDRKDRQEAERIAREKRQMASILVDCLEELGVQFLRTPPGVMDELVNLLQRQVESPANANTPPHAGSPTLRTPPDTSATTPMVVSPEAGGTHRVRQEVRMDQYGDVNKALERTHLDFGRRPTQDDRNTE